MRRALLAILLGATMPLPARAQPVPGTLMPPVLPACISSPFGWRHSVGADTPAGLHPGIDLPAPAGALARAAAAGQVLKIERRGIGGLQVMLQHRGFVTLYAHLGALVPALAEGRRVVAAGEPLGRIGRTGITYGTHLFFEVLVDGRPVDPTQFLPLAHC